MARKRWEFTYSPKAVEQLWDDRRLAALLGQLADQATERARELAPTETGRYAASFDSTVNTGKDGRPIGRAFNTVRYAVSVELGSARNGRKHRCLGRGADSLRGLLR